MAKMSKGVVVEFDFAVLNGSEILFETASSILKGYGITLDARLEALHLAGGNYQGALAELFGKVDCEADAAAVARELNAAFNAAVAAKAAAAVTPAFKNFIQTLQDKGVKVVVATRGDAAALAVDSALAGVGGVVGKDEDDSNTIRACEFTRVKGGKPFNVRNSRFRKMLREIGQPRVRKTRVVKK